MIQEQSKALFERGSKSLVGSVNSPVRAFNSVGGNPVFIQNGKGAYIYDVDGNEYIDLVGSYGPLILGHANPAVVEQVQKAVERGMTFGASTAAEIELAEEVKVAFPHVDKVRFVNSGTEAVISAIRLARAFTGRSKIVKFAGCYHGHSDALLVAAGSGVATLGIPGSKGVPQEAVQNTLIAEYNNIESVKTLIETFPDEIAGIFLEPVAGNMGVVVPEKDFMQSLRNLCNQHGILMVVDEVMTGFRQKYGGAQDYFDVQADISCLGKVIGGGMPVGAYCGRAEIMDMVAPLGPVYQAGTLSGNPIAMACGLATLQGLKALDPYHKLDAQTKQIATAIHEAANAKGIPITVNRFGSMVNAFFTQGPVTDFNSAQQSDTKRFAAFFWALMDAGVYIPPSQFEAWFLPAILEDSQMDQLLAGIKKAISSLNV